MHNHLAEDLLINNKQKIKIFMMLLRAFGQAQSAMDIMYATPQRVWQVFGGKSFDLIAGIAQNPLLSPLIVGLSIAGSLPFIAKLFVKDRVNNLGIMLDNLEKEFDVKLNLNSMETRGEVIERFNAFLKKRGLFHLQAKITTKKVGIFTKKDKTSLKFKYIDPMIDFFGAHWLTIKDKPMFEAVKYILHEANNKPNQQNSLISLYSPKNDLSLTNKANDATIELIKQIFSPQKEKSSVTEASISSLFNLFKQNPTHVVRSVLNSKQFTKKQENTIILLSRLYGFFINQNGDFDKELTLENSRKHFIEKINAVSFSDVINQGYNSINDFTYNFWLSYFCNDILDGRDDTGLWNRLDQIIVLAVAGGITLVQAGLKLANYIRNKNNPEQTPLNINYSNKTLKHQLLEEFFIEEITKKQLKKADIHQYPLPLSPSHQQKIKNILDNKTGCKSSKISKQFQLLQTAYDPNHAQLAKRAATILTNTLSQGILVGFMGWVLGAILVAAGAAAVGAVILSNPVGLAFFVLGMSIGATWFADRQIKKDKQTEKNMQADIANNLPKMQELETLENQNKQLRALLKEKDVPRLTVAKAHDDRRFRRLTTEKGGALTIVKKTLNRLFVGMDKMGAGILIMRLTVLPLLTIGLAAAVSNPIGLGIALGFGVVWSIFHIVKYHQEHQLAKSQRTLEDIDNRIIAAKANQQVYLKQLRYQPTGKVNNTNVSLPSIEPESPDNSLEKLSTPISILKHNLFSCSKDDKVSCSTKPYTPLLPPIKKIESRSL